MLSGTLCGWGDFAVRFFDMVIFLSVPHEERMNRYISRYTQEFGYEILKSGHYLHNRYKAFKTWSSSYDDGKSGLYSKVGHEKWLEKLSCPVIRIDGDISINETLRIALNELSHFTLPVNKFDSVKNCK